jgi:hypothetical protein
MDTSSPFRAGAIPPPMPMYELPRPSPPRLHWGWVLALDILTRSLFGVVWLVVQANWVRKVRGHSTAFVLSIIHMLFYPGLFVMAFIVGMMGATAGSSLVTAMTVAGSITAIVLWVATVFTLRSELSASPIDIPLGGVMTFFFGSLYFQYFLHDYETGYGGKRAVDGILGLSQPNS